MFIFTAKLHRKRVAIGAVALVLVCGILATFAGSHSLWGAQSVSGSVSPNGIKTNEDRVSYLAQFGWTTTPEALTVEEMQIPAVMDASFEAYLATQAEQGFDLSKYLGKTAKRYTYGITNYPGGANVMASLLIYKNTVIAGDVFAADTGEVLHGLARPS